MVDAKKSFEENLPEFFPARWTKKEIAFFLNGEHPSVDVTALRVNLNTPIRDFVLRGGKRLRPALFFEALTMFGVDPKKYEGIAVVIELVHNATLMLDDIEDRATQRRGKPTIHLTYGIDTAVNTGMALHILPLQIFQKYKSVIDSETQLQLWEVYTEELTKLSLGQALDIYWHKHRKNHITVAKYLEMVSLKSGSLFSLSIGFACAIAKQSKEVREDMMSFARTLGAAFQIRDDILDLAESDATFGKSYGNDITEGKMSLPALYALALANDDESTRLRAILMKHTRNKALIAEALRIIRSSGGLKRASVQSEKLLSQSISVLKDKYQHTLNIEPLEELAFHFIKRKN